jgi:opacity protein-like surface antigen
LAGAAIGSTTFEQRGTLGSAQENRAISNTSRMEWLGTLRLRGGVGIDRLLVYGTGGLAFGVPKTG